MCIRRGERKGKQGKEKEKKMEEKEEEEVVVVATTSNPSSQDLLLLSNNTSFKQQSHDFETFKLEMNGRVQSHLHRIDQETKRLATIRQELEALSDPMHKELSVVRKRLDSVDKELKPLELNAQKKEKEYKDTLDAFNEKNKEKVQLVTRLMELVGESEKMRMEKLEELSKSIEPVQRAN